MTALVRMEHHASEIAAIAPDGKFVLSRLPRGESPIRCAVPSIKLVLEGEEIHEVDGRPYRIVPGRMLYVDAGPPYIATVRRNVATVGLCVYLPAGEEQYPWPSLLGRAVIQPVDTPFGRMLREFALILDRTGGVGVDATEMMRTFRFGLAEEVAKVDRRVARLDVKKASTRHEVVNRLEVARSYLHAHRERAIPLSELACEAGLSSFHLARYFSTVFGVPPARYHRELRLQHAHGLLRDGQVSATEIAQRAGYSELSAFSHAFRRQFGMPPSAVAR